MDQSDLTPMSSDPSTSPENRNLTAKTIIGDEIKNMEGEVLGRVEDLMLDVDGGKIEYAVVAHGGVLGLGEKLFAVPWSAFSIDRPGQFLVLNLDKDVLRTAEGFDKDSWPNTADPEWREKIEMHYRMEPLEPDEI
jgi:sporulation protein YlmC with PRC-barrel domain